MSQPILITGAAVGLQGSTGRLVAELLLKQGIPVCNPDYLCASADDHAHRRLLSAGACTAPAISAVGAMLADTQKGELI